MDITQTQSPTPVAPEATPSSTAPVESIAVAPVVENTPTPVTENTPVTPAPVVETVLGEALTEAPKEAPVEQTTQESPKVEGEQPKPEETKNTEGQSDEPAPPPVFDPFKFPDGLNPKEERVKEFTDILSNLEQSGKVDHALVQEFGQKAVDFHIAEIQRVVSDVEKAYQTHWDRQKLQWKEAFLQDPEIGGNRHQTTVDSALYFIRTHGGTAEQQAEFRSLMESSGLGNHPAMIRILANAGRVLSEGKPLAAPKPPSAPKSKISTMYGGTAG